MALSLTINDLLMLVFFPPAQWVTLTNAESMLCMGSGRMPLSRRNLTDLQMTPLESDLTEDVESLRELRLRLLGELYNSVEQSRNVKLKSASDVEHWFDHISLITANLDRLKRMIWPLPSECIHLSPLSLYLSDPFIYLCLVVLNTDKFYFSMMRVYQHSCRLLTVYLAMADATIVYQSPQSGPFWFLDVRPRGMTVMVTWGKDAMFASEALLTEFLTVEERYLITVPDSLFDILAFSCCFITSVRLMVLRSSGFELKGATNLLLHKIKDLLIRLPVPIAHPAKRAARICDMMIQVWEDRNRVLAKKASQGTSVTELKDTLQPPQRMRRPQQQQQQQHPQHRQHHHQHQHQHPYQHQHQQASSSSSVASGSGSPYIPLPGMSPSAGSSPATSSSMHTPLLGSTSSPEDRQQPLPYAHVLENLFPLQMQAGANVDSTEPNMWAANPGMMQDSTYWDHFFGELNGTIPNGGGGGGGGGGHNVSPF